VARPPPRQPTAIASYDRDVSRPSVLAASLLIAAIAAAITVFFATRPTETPPRSTVSAPPSPPAVTPAEPTEDAALDDAHAASLARVWLLYGNAAERARATETLARLHAAAPAMVSATTMTSLSPSAAWTAQAARRRDVEETLDLTVPAHAAAIDVLRRRFSDEIRAALPSWKPTGADDRLGLARLANECADRKATIDALLSLFDDRDEAGHVAATWLVTISIDDGALERAAKALRRIRDVFDGQGLDDQDRTMPVSLLAAAVVEQGDVLARALVEGPAPDVVRAKAAVAVAQAVAQEFSIDDRDAPLVSNLRYVGLADGSFDLAATIAGFPAVDGPRVVVFSDDFQLGETILVSVLRRWSKGIAVTLVGRITGKTRSGMRRVTVASPAAERVAMTAHAKAEQLRIGGFVERGGAEESRLGFTSEGATAPGVVLFVLDRDHRLVARLSGNSLDPRPLDGVIARLVPDPSVVAPPSEAGPR
jgi:hypothetical protein